MTNQDLAILAVPMLLSLAGSLWAGLREADRKKEFGEVFGKAVSLHGKIISFGLIGWIVYARGMRLKLIGAVCYAAAFLVVGMIDYVVLSRKSKARSAGK